LYFQHSAFITVYLPKHMSAGTCKFFREVTKTVMDKSVEIIFSQYLELRDIVES